jgi:membrane dipeptidase
MIAVFDGHNDALTREDHADLATGRSGGHLDLPRMRAGGVRGAIFAVFTSTPGDEEEIVPRFDGVVEAALAEQVSQAAAAAFATRAAGRLLALERAGHVRVARAIADIDAARDGDGPPAAVLHL